MAGRSRTADADTDLITSMSIILHTSRGETPLRAVSSRALTDAAADVRQFALTANGLTIEPAPFDARKLPSSWQQALSQEPR